MPPTADAGVTLNYRCGVADAGTNKPCAALPASVIGILIQSSDSDPVNLLQDSPPTNEFGYIQCSALASGASQTSFTIEPRFWKTAFPNGNWKTIRTVVTHLGLRIANTSTLIGAGGGQVGMTIHP